MTPGETSAREPEDHISGMPGVMRATRADGSAIAFELFGDRGGAPLVLSHGLSDSRRSARILDATARDLGCS